MYSKLNVAISLVMFAIFFYSATTNPPLGWITNVVILLISVVDRERTVMIKNAGIASAFVLVAMMIVYPL